MHLEKSLHLPRPTDHEGRGDRDAFRSRQDFEPIGLVSARELKKYERTAHKRHALRVVWLAKATAGVRL